MTTYRNRGEDAVIPFEKCPVCGGEVIRKPTEKLLRGGVNIATMTADADVCLRCGQRLYSAETVHSFEEIRSKLHRQQVEEFELIGRSFRVPADSTRMPLASEIQPDAERSGSGDANA